MYPMRRISQARTKGFTLIELMVVVIVIGILAAIAIPTYNEQVMRSRRAEATTTILAMAQELERCFTRFSAYNNAACTLQNGGTRTSENGWYVVTAEVPNATTFALTAVPQGQQAVRDTRCANFTYNHIGRRGVTGTYSSDPGRCW